MRSVRIESFNEGRNARVFEASSGAEIKGITRIAVVMTPQDGSRAVLDVAVLDVSMEADARFRARNPATGNYDDLASMTFADGTTVTF